MATAGSDASLVKAYIADKSAISCSANGAQLNQTSMAGYR
jgi:hypothetical protein